MWHVCEINLERLLDLVFAKGLNAVNELVEGIKVFFYITQVALPSL